MQEIWYKEILVGIKISTIKKGSIPVTKGKEPLQMVTLKHPKGSYLKAHAHVPKRRVTSKMQECLIVKKGAVKIDLYAPLGKKFEKFKTVSLIQGQIFILMNGGFGIHIMKDAELIEVKNGPFIEDKILI